MYRSSITFLQAVIVLICVGVFAFLLFEPPHEGHNAHATLFEIYFKDPFLAYAYLASIPFFAAHHQAFKVLGYVRQERTFSPVTAKALRTIRRCAVAVACFVAVSVVFMVSGDREDRPPGLFMRVLVGLPAITVAAAVTVFQRILKDAVDKKAGSDAKP